MTLSRNRKRWLIFIGSILLLLIILILFANSFLSKKADAMLRIELSKMDSTEYVIDFEKVRVNIFSRSVKIFDVSVKPTDATLENVKSSQLAMPVLDLKLEQIKVSSVSVMKALRGEEFDIGGISLRKADISIYGHGELFKKNAHQDGGKSIFSSDTVVETGIKEARLNSFKLDISRLCYVDLSKGDTLLETKDLNITVSDLWLHQPENDTSSHVLEVDDIEIALSSHSMELPGGFYRLETSSLEMSYKDGEFSLDSLKLIPAYPKGRFSKAFGKQTDRFEVTAGNIFIGGIVFDSLMNKKLIADEIRLSSPRADICRDKRVARDMSIFPKLFQTSVAQLPIQVYVKSVNASKAYVNYQEIVKDSDQAGSVVLDQLVLNIKGMCNYPDSIKNGQALLVEANALLMGKSSFKIYLNLPIGNHAEYFTFHGHADAFPASNLNSLIQPLAAIEATGGSVNSVDFYAMAMNDTTAGRINFKYSDLEVAVLKKKKNEEGLVKENKFYSFAAQTAIHKNNPSHGKEVRIARMSFVRDPNKGFFNYIWKTLQHGLITTLTPGKKHLATDESWPEFKNNWRKTLLNDWKDLQVHDKKKKSK
ncbi:MAG: hypothetical protein DRJ15_02045 [Bacteroidetes bacterium]|nr:MAG: hypothetical protein DRJ15_02045 [Bacteroidota bacterium]